MKRTLLQIAGLAFLVTACASHPHTYSIKLDSDPEGAHVFMATGSLKKTGARDFIGNTPCVATITGDKHGYFTAPQIDYVSDYVAGVVTFTFDPPSDSTNLYSHSQSYRTPTNYRGGDKIPQGIFFDLHKP